jgi:hypothetical protein
MSRPRTVARPTRAEMRLGPGLFRLGMLQGPANAWLQKFFTVFLSWPPFTSRLRQTRGLGSKSNNVHLRKKEWIY